MPATIHPDTITALDAAPITKQQRASARYMLEELVRHEHYQPMEFTATINTECPAFCSVSIQGNRTDCDRGARAIFSAKFTSTSLSVNEARANSAPILAGPFITKSVVYP